MRCNPQQFHYSSLSLTMFNKIAAVSFALLAAVGLVAAEQHTVYFTVRASPS